MKTTGPYRKKRLAASLLATLAGCAAPGADVDEPVEVTEQAIVGGIEVADLAAYPGVGGLVDYSEPASRLFCGGVLIAPDWVATSAHCFDKGTIGEGCLETVNNGLTSERCEFVTGHLDWKDAHLSTRGAELGRDFFHMERIYKHSKYPANDIALIKLTSPVPPATARPIAILGSDWVSAIPSQLDSSAVEPDAFMTVVGWGASGAAGDAVDEDPWALENTHANQLWEASLDYMGDKDQCMQDTYYHANSGLRDENFCVGDGSSSNLRSNQYEVINGQRVYFADVSNGICSGDSGGPVYWSHGNGTDVVVPGLITSSFGCALAGFPAVIERIGDYYEAFMMRDGNPFGLSEPVPNVHVAAKVGSYRPASRGAGMWFGGSTATHKPQSADLNNDGYDDIIYRGKCGSSSADCWRAHLGGASGFSTTSYGNGMSFYSDALASTPLAGDFNADGYDDLVYRGKCGGDNHECWRVHQNNQRGGFSIRDYGKSVWFESSNATSTPVVGDFNADGYADIAYYGRCGADSHRCWRVHMNNRAGGFSVKDYGDRAWFYTSGVTSTPMAGDFNADGYTDIAYRGKCGSGGQCWRVHMNDRAGGFTVASLGSDMRFYDTSSAVGAPFAIDHDGDGFSDIAYQGTCGSSSPCWRVELNSNGRTAYPHDAGARMWLRYTDARSAPMVGDFNRDGVDDIGYYGRCGTGSGSDCWRTHELSAY